MISDGSELQEAPEEIQDGGLFLTKEQTARDLDISTRTLERWVKEGEFPAPYRIGSHAYWDTRCLIEWSRFKFMEANPELQETLPNVGDLPKAQTRDASDPTAPGVLKKRYSRKAFGAKSFSPIEVTRKRGDSLEN